MEFEEIYRNYFSSVYKYIRQLSGDEHIAQEITSETFFRAINSLNSFRGDCDMRVWLCQIAKNVYFSYLKKGSRSQSADEAELLSIRDPVIIEDMLATQDEARRVRSILHDIPEPYKEVFMWRVFGELSFREIGELYSKTDNWACVTYHRARKMIQKKLEEDWYEE